MSVLSGNFIFSISERRSFEGLPLAIRQFHFVADISHSIRFVPSVSFPSLVCQMSSTKTIEEKPKKGHWTQKINRENRDLKELNRVLMNELKKQGSDIVIQLSTSETSSAVGSGGYDGGNPLMTNEVMVIREEMVMEAVMTLTLTTLMMTFSSLLPTNSLRLP